MKKCIFILLLFSLCATFSAKAQYYTGIGLRGGYLSGITVKHFFDSNNANAIEGIGTFRYRDVILTALYESQHPINDSRMQANLDWFVGFGAHIGFYDRTGYYYKKSNGKTYSDGTATNFGIDGIIGLEYKIPVAPFTIGLDLKPFVEFVNYYGLFFDAGLSLRYVF